jgi:hypothetical protein
MEQRLVFDIKDVGIRVVCHKCHSAFLSMGPEWKAIQSCIACGKNDWHRELKCRASDLADVIRNLEAEQRSGVQTFDVQIEVQASR